MRAARRWDVMVSDLQIRMARFDMVEVYRTAAEREGLRLVAVTWERDRPGTSVLRFSDES